MLAYKNKKVCSSCKKKLNLNKFNKHSKTKDNLQNCCKVCKVKMTRNWKYAFKTGQLDEMKKIQNNCCAICLNKTKDLVIDHCHRTDIIRQLLCRKCNALLGMCNDNVLILANSIEYIKKWTEE